MLDYNPRMELTSEDLASYNMAILDPDQHPPMELLNQIHYLIAYISIGEAENYRSYWEKIKDRPWVLEENPNWKGNYLVDIRNPEWQSILLKELIPQAINAGFKGIMLDTVDTAIELESRDPQRYANTKNAMVQFIAKIHKRFPHLYLLPNNGYSLLPEIAPYISGVIAEDIFWMPDFENNTYVPVPEEDRRQKIISLNKVMESHQLPIFSIDYVSQKDPDMIRQTLEKARKLGFVPYVAEKNLSRLYQN